MSTKAPIVLSVSLEASPDLLFLRGMPVGASLSLFYHQTHIIDHQTQQRHHPDKNFLFLIFSDLQNIFSKILVGRKIYLSL